MDIETLKLKLNDYESNKISREELIDWAYQMLNRMIKSKEVLTLKGIFAYPFISEISINKNSWEAVNDVAIKEYIRILHGEKDFNYLFATKLDKGQWDKQLIIIEEILNNYIQNNYLKDNEYDYLIDFVENKQGFELTTLSDLVMSNIINYIDCVPENMQNELKVSSLYIQDEIKNSTEYIKFINNLIKAYCGRTNLYININYSKYGNNLTLGTLL